ncbi:MAG: hypothetical protein G01um101419_543 [Parcubacteria group bacterium Gr01-1014_19]|nr:MAG: hypothetical protein G01um101419_543 [Parcubacteria group bacterium Gr01-1014_19]
MKRIKWPAVEVASIFILVMLAIQVFQDRVIPFAITILALVGIVIASFVARMRKIRKDLGSCTPTGRKLHIAERVADYTEELGVGRWWKNTERGWEITFLDCSWIWKIAGLTILALALILAAGYHFRPEFWLIKNFWDKIQAKLLWYCFLWGPIQQFILQGYVTNKLYSMFAADPNTRKCDNKAALNTALVSGLLFFFAHIPNPTLMIVTPIAGAVTAYIFLHCRNVYMMGIAHGILGTALTYCLADSMRVGPHYWQ